MVIRLITYRSLQWSDFCADRGRFLPKVACEDLSAGCEAGDALLDDVDLAGQGRANLITEFEYGTVIEHAWKQDVERQG